MDHMHRAAPDEMHPMCRPRSSSHRGYVLSIRRSDSICMDLALVFWREDEPRRRTTSSVGQVPCMLRFVWTYSRWGVRGDMNKACCQKDSARGDRCAQAPIHLDALLQSSITYHPPCHKYADSDIAAAAAIYQHMALQWLLPVICVVCRAQICTTVCASLSLRQVPRWLDNARLRYISTAVVHCMSSTDTICTYAVDAH